MNQDITRLYFALTNFCNRACELCSCHSDPSRGTFLSFEQFLDILKPHAHYEAQLEGGEPTIHPDFERMVQHCMNDQACDKVVLCTNAVVVPIQLRQGQVQEEESLVKVRQWLSQFQAKPFVLKPSINSHLIQHSRVHMQKMVLLAKAWDSMEWKEGSQLLYNVRRIPAPMTPDGEQWMVEQLKTLELYERCNDFFYQRYGKAKDEEDLAVPYIISNPVKFYLIAPDGKNFDTDLVGRADYMEKMQ